MEPEPPFFAWSRSRLRDLGFQEPEPPKKVAAPRHCHLALMAPVHWSNILAYELDDLVLLQR